VLLNQLLQPLEVSSTPRKPFIHISLLSSRLTSALTIGFGAPAAPAPSASLFGAAPAAPSLFGQPAAPQSSLFGAPAAPSSPFGAPAAAAAPPSLFGAPQPAPSLFGAPAPAAPAGGGLFGQSSLFSTPPAPAPAPSLFGSTFGQPAAAAPAPAPAPFSFGQSQAAASNSLFGPPSSAPSLFNSQAPAQIPLPPAALPKLGSAPLSPPNQPSIETRLEKIKNAWDPNSPQCRFQTYFYNVVDLSGGRSTSMYGRPPGGTDETAWTKAVRENPESDKYVLIISLSLSLLHFPFSSFS
jgi:nuclear pore complex protein Nup54